MGLCGLVLVILVVMVLLLLLLRAVLSFGLRFRVGVGCWVGVRIEVEEDLVLEVRGNLCLVGGGSGCAAGMPGLPVWGRGASGSLARGCSFGFGFGLAVALWMRSAGRAGWEEEVESVHEDEDEEGMVVLGDVGCATMRAGAALWAAAEGMSSGCRLGAGGWGGPAVTWRPARPIQSAARAGEARGRGLCLRGSAGLGSCNA